MFVVYIYIILVMRTNVCTTTTTTTHQTSIHRKDLSPSSIINRTVNPKHFNHTNTNTDMLFYETK